MMALTPLFTDAEARMRRVLEALRKELATIRTGRANPALVENLTVDYYGVPTPLSHLASITAPEARLLVIQPWDKEVLSLVEKAILRSDLGLVPSNDGRLLRLPLPPLTEERRRELVRLVRKKVEEGRVALRNIRQEVHSRLRAMERDKQLSQDDHRRAQERLQKLTDAFTAQADQLAAAKEAEVLQE